MKAWIHVPLRAERISARFRSTDRDYVLINPNAQEHVLDAQPHPQSSYVKLESRANVEQEALSDNCSTEFQTASQGTTTFHSAVEAASIATDDDIRIAPRPSLSADNEHLARARRIGITKVQAQELNWSGFGEHVQFANEGEVPLKSLFEIARSAGSIVDAVQCRRVRLARKRILCHRHLTPEEALAEVRYIQVFRHRHIIQCVGSYSLGKWIGILTYPVARCNLEQFLHETTTLNEYDMAAIYNRQALVKFFACLSCAVESIHGEGIKHMDIKPQNILVNTKFSEVNQLRKMDIYITDFGISRTVEDLDHSQTDGPTGCVFTEMATVISGRTLEEFCSFRSDDGCSFHLNLSLVHVWIKALKKATVYWDGMWNPRLRDTVIGMLSEEPDMRPTAMDLKLLLGSNLCCNQRQEIISAVE